MKRLFLLAAVLAFAGSTIGCRCCDWLFRGANYNPNPCPPAVYGNPCYPANPCDPCDPCATPGLTPGAETYTPGPG